MTIPCVIVEQSAAGTSEHRLTISEDVKYGTVRLAYESKSTTRGPHDFDFHLEVGKLGDDADEVDVLVSALRRAQGAIRRERGDFDHV